MSTIVTVAQTYNITSSSQTSARKKMTITPVDGGASLTIPYAPREIEHSNLSASYEEVARNNRQPLLVRQPSTQPRMNYTLFLGSIDPEASCVPLIKRLAQIARGVPRVRVSYTSFESGVWRISSLGPLTITRRHPLTHEPTRAEVDVEMILDEDLTRFIGPVSGGVQNVSPLIIVKDAKGSKKVRYHVIKKGDTLQKLAIKYYKDVSKWRKIAKANKIDNPKKLKVGRKIKIPR